MINADEMMMIFKSVGWFEKGRWVTPYSQMRERMGEIPVQKYELIQHDAEPIFKAGACIGYRNVETVIGIFTAEEIDIIHGDTVEMQEQMSRTEIRSLP
ncbi:MAG: hypothetical protein ABR999_10820 [Methanoregula sp.]|jgi:hypothetical protein|uniref:hypothetical protein n=1 Tax=Methanoregula sp. TaxID=2052170 RepID=UPI003D0ED750